MNTAVEEGGMASFFCSEPPTGAIGENVFHRPQAIKKRRIMVRRFRRKTEHLPAQGYFVLFFFFSVWTSRLQVCMILIYWDRFIERASNSPSSWRLRGTATLLTRPAVILLDIIGVRWYGSAVRSRHNRMLQQSRRAGPCFVYWIADAPTAGSIPWSTVTPTQTIR